MGHNPSCVISLESQGRDVGDTQSSDNDKIDRSDFMSVLIPLIVRPKTNPRSENKAIVVHCPYYDF